MVKLHFSTFYNYCTASVRYGTLPKDQDKIGTGDWRGGGIDDGEYPLGLVDGGSGNEERRGRIAVDSGSDNGGKQARQDGEGDHSTRSVGLWQEGVDAGR